MRLKRASREINVFWAVAGRWLTTATRPVPGPLVGACEPAPCVLFVVPRCSDSCSWSPTSGDTGCGAAGVGGADMPPTDCKSVATITPAPASTLDASHTAHAATATHQVRFTAASRPERGWNMVMALIITQETPVSSGRGKNFLGSGRRMAFPGRRVVGFGVQGSGFGVQGSGFSH